MSERATVDVQMHLHRSTLKAIFVSDDGEEKHAVWLPRALLSIEPAEHEPGEVITITMGERLAYEKGLL